MLFFLLYFKYVMNSNIQSETEFLPTDYKTWIAPIRSVGSITGVYNDASLRAMESVMADLWSFSCIGAQSCFGSLIEILLGF